MSLIDRTILEWAWMSEKGYPDINNENDLRVFESLFGFDLNEQNMSGGATGYPGATGTFRKYVTDKENSSEFLYTADKDATIIPVKGGENINIKKGEEFNIITKKDTDLIKKGPSTYATIKYKNSEYLIRLTDINKPTGKGVEKFEPGDSKKNKTGVLNPFIPGHPQEKDVALLFQNASNEDYEFDHKGKKFEISYIGEPRGKTHGKPKTDLFIELDKPIPEINSKDLKISLKAGNAIFVENWTIPQRALSIFDKDRLKQEIIKVYEGIVNNTLLKKGTKALNLAFFIATTSQSYSVDGRGPLKLTDEEALEAYSGAKKFGADSELTPNCFFKGQVPSTISEFCSKLLPLDSSALKYLEDLYVYVRGSNESRGQSLFIRRETIDSPWYISPNWLEALGIKEVEKDGIKVYK